MNDVNQVVDCDDQEDLADTAGSGNLYCKPFLLFYVMNYLNTLSIIMVTIINPIFTLILMQICICF